MSHERPTSPPLAPPAPAGEGPLVDNKLVLGWFALSAVGMVLGPLLGVLASMKLDDPDLLGGIHWLQFGRLRIAHVNFVIFAAFTPAMFGLMCHAVPRLTGRPLVGARAAWAALVIMALALAVGLPCLLFGYLQPVEAGELPMVVDAMATLVFVLMTGVVLGTVAKRKEKKLYVALWYWVASFVWTDVNYLLGVIGLNFVAKGTTSAAMHGFYLHNVVGLWITPAGVGAAYYLLPVATRTTLFSHRLSLIGFWALAFFYPMNGVHHYIWSPIADWAQTIAIASSMMLILPVWAFCANMWGTMRGQWPKFAGPGNHVIKMTMFGAVWYLITCFQGPTEALRGMQALTHFGDYNVGHAHSAVFAVFAIWAVASGYLCVPRASGRELWSNKLASWTYWLEIFGFTIMFCVLSVSGLQQGAMLQNGQLPWIDTVDSIRPLWIARTFGGTLMDVGLAFYTLNLAMTAKRGKRAKPAADAPAAAY
ncbi:MAG: cbb3-type cytochrome c oxidase subunit I [Planctomycetes bacterium]|nr:cbb3-type cytochrome c oxidase subunit I [Planctomycetota bacterium]